MSRIPIPCTTFQPDQSWRLYSPTTAVAPSQRNDSRSHTFTTYCESVYMSTLDAIWSSWTSSQATMTADNCAREIDCLPGVSPMAVHRSSGHGSFNCKAFFVIANACSGFNATSRITAQAESLDSKEFGWMHVPSVKYTWFAHPKTPESQLQAVWWKKWTDETGHNPHERD